MVADYKIMLWTDVYLNRVCAKVYKIKVFKVYLEIEQWRLAKANLLGMTACMVAEM